MLAALLILLLAIVVSSVSGCGDSDPYTGSWGTFGSLKIDKKGDTYLIHDEYNALGGTDYEGKIENGKLVAKDKFITHNFTVEGDWLVDTSTTIVVKYEKN